MANIFPIETLRFIPESYLPSAPYIPFHFLPEYTYLDATKFEFELDELGQTSIIRLVIDNEIFVPYVDFSRYDSETKNWLWYDSSGNFPYRYQRSTNKLENLYPSTYSNLSGVSSLEFNKDSRRLEAAFMSSTGLTNIFYKFSPIVLTVNNQAFNDLTDYANLIPSENLNKIDTTVPEFYYDFNSRIYTNRNLAGVDPTQIRLHYFRISDNTVQVKCRISSNTGTETYYTPKVNHFIVKLKGQSLRA